MADGVIITFEDGSAQFIQHLFCTTLPQAKAVKDDLESGDTDDIRDSDQKSIASDGRKI